LFGFEDAVVEYLLMLMFYRCIVIGMNVKLVVKYCSERNG